MWSARFPVTGKREDGSVQAKNLSAMPFLDAGTRLGRIIEPDIMEVRP